MAKKGKKTQVPAKQKSGGAVALPFEEDAGGGFENADVDSYAIPYLQILQKGSPQVDEDHGSYIKGARAGMLYNSATKDVYSGEEGVLVVPAHFERVFVEWTPREAGGGFRGRRPANDPIIAKCRRDESGKFWLKDDEAYLADTRYHFCILIDDDGNTQPVVFSLASTQIKKSRDWMTQMQHLKIERADGSKFTPPTYSHMYRVTTVGEAKDDYTWKGVKIELERQLGSDKKQRDADVALYEGAKGFREQVMSGVANVAPPPDEGSSDDEAF